MKLSPDYNNYTGCRFLAEKIKKMTDEGYIALESAIADQGRADYFTGMIWVWNKAKETGKEHLVMEYLKGSPMKTLVPILKLYKRKNNKDISDTIVYQIYSVERYVYSKRLKSIIGINGGDILMTYKNTFLEYIESGEDDDILGLDRRRL